MSGVFVHEPWLKTIVNLATDSTTVYTGKCLIGNIWVDTALSAHACPIKDGETTIFTIPASAALNTLYEHLRGTVLDTSLIVDPNDSGTGIIVVQYWPI